MFCSPASCGHDVRVRGCRTRRWGRGRHGGGPQRRTGGGGDGQKEEGEVDRIWMRWTEGGRGGQEEEKLGRRRKRKTG